MLRNPLFTGNGDGGGFNYGETRNASDASDEEPIKVLTELKSFKPYLTKRLEYILMIGKSLELSEEVNDIRFYLDVMGDSTADISMGIDGVRSCINKLHEMSYKHPLPDRKEWERLRKQKENPTDGDDDISVVSGGSQNEDQRSQTGSDEYIEVTKCRDKAKAYQDFLLKESIRKADEEIPENERETSNSSNWYNDFKVSEKASTSQDQSNESGEQPRKKVSWFNRDRSEDLDNISVLSDRFERRDKSKPLFEDPRIKKQEMPPKPIIKNSQFGSHSNHPGVYPAATPVFLPFPNPGPARQRPSSEPSWLRDSNPVFEDTRQSTYGYESVQQPTSAPLPSLFIPNYGHVNIAALQAPFAPAPMQPSMNFQAYGYQVPSELRPNPCYDPAQYPQPMMIPPQTFAYSQNVRGHSQRSRGGMHPGSKRPPRQYAMARPPSYTESMHTFEPNPEPEQYSADDNFSSVSETAAHQRTNPFHRKTRGSPFNRGRNFNQSRGKPQNQGSVKRVNLAEPEKPKKKPNVNSPLAQLRKKLEQDRSQMFRLGQNKKVVEPEPVPEPEPISTYSEDEDESLSPPSPTSPPNADKQFDILQAVSLVMESDLSDREKTRLLKNPEELKKYKREADKDERKRQKEKSKKTSAPKVAANRKSTRKTSKKVKFTLQEVHNTTVGLSSESETGSLVSGVSTRSASRRNPTSALAKSSKPPASPSLGKAKKSTGKRNSSASSSTSVIPKPRKRAQPIVESSESEGEEEKATSSSADDSGPQACDEIVKDPIKKPKSFVEQAVEELRQENRTQKALKRKLRKKEKDQMQKLSKRKFAHTISAEGRQIVGRNDLCVSQKFNKISIVNDEMNKVKMEPKEEVEMTIVKDEVDVMDCNPEDDFMLIAMSHVETQLGAPEDTDHPSKENLETLEDTREVNPEEVPPQQEAEVRVENGGQGTINCDNQGTGAVEQGKSNIEQNEEGASDKTDEQIEGEESVNRSSELVSDFARIKKEVTEQVKEPEIGPLLEENTMQQAYEDEDDDFIAPTVLNVQGNYTAPESHPQSSEDIATSDSVNMDHD